MTFSKLNKKELEEIIIKLKDIADSFKFYLLEEFMGHYAELNSIFRSLNEFGHIEIHRNEVNQRLSDLVSDVIYLGCEIQPEHFIGSEIFFLNDVKNINKHLLFTSMRHDIHKSLLNNENLK